MKLTLLALLLLTLLASAASMDFSKDDDMALDLARDLDIDDDMTLEFLSGRRMKRKLPTQEEIETELRGHTMTTILNLFKKTLVLDKSAVKPGRGVKCAKLVCILLLRVTVTLLVLAIKVGKTTLLGIFILTIRIIILWWYLILFLVVKAVEGG